MLAQDAKNTLHLQEEEEETIPFARKEIGFIDHVDAKENDLIFQFDSNVENIVSSHQTLLTGVKHYFGLILYTIVSFSFTYSSRANLIVLYAREMKNDTSLISVFLYLSYICSGLASFLFGHIGNKWRFDALLLIAALMDIITFGLEATTSNIYVLMISYAIGGQPFQTIGQACNLKMVPTHYAKLIRASITQYCAVAAIIGNIAGGIIAYLISYRATFYAAFVTSIILFLFVAIFIFNKEKPLLDKQLTMLSYYRSADISIKNHDSIDEHNINNMVSGDNDCTISLSSIKDHKRSNSWYNWIISEDFRFPNCLIEMRKEKANINMNGDDNSIRTEVTGNYRRSSKYLGSIIGCLIFTSGLLIAIEPVVLIYFTAYMIDVYNINTALSTSGCAVWALSLIIGMESIKQMIRKDAKTLLNTNNDDFTNNNINKFGWSNKYIILTFVSLNGLIITNLVIFPLIKTLSIHLFGSNVIQSGDLTTKQSVAIMAMYWLAFVVSGIFLGISYVIGEFITVELIPKDIAGTIAGVKGMTRSFCKGVFVLIIGLLWNVDSSIWMWYIQGFQCCVAVLIIIAIASLESSGLFSYYN